MWRPNVVVEAHGLAGVILRVWRTTDLPCSLAFPTLQGVSRKAKEVVLTLEQAKQARLQKGYVLEPVLPTFTDDASLPDKRERKKSSHFGNTCCLVLRMHWCSYCEISAQVTVHQWTKCKALAAHRVPQVLQQPMRPSQNLDPSRPQQLPARMGWQRAGLEAMSLQPRPHPARGLRNARPCRFPSETDKNHLNHT